MHIEVHNRLFDVIRQRETAGFTFNPTHEFYRGIGIHKRRFGQFLRNEKQPTLDEIGRLASVLSINPNELIVSRGSVKSSISK
jgi:hypothetical protein